jgi:hypothetical protein
MADLSKVPAQLDPKKGTCRAIIDTPEGCRNEFDFDPDSGLGKTESNDRLRGVAISWTRRCDFNRNYVGGSRGSLRTLPGRRTRSTGLRRITGAERNR